MTEKLLDAITFKCTADFKRLVVAVAMTRDMDASDFVRQAIESRISEERAVYEALHSVFGTSNKTEENKV